LIVILGALLSLIVFTQGGFTPSRSFRAYAEIPGTYTPPSHYSLQINLTSGDILRVIASSSTNITVLSLSGGQYDLGLYTSGSKNDLLFTPAQIANYTLSLNVSTASSDIISISDIGTSQSTWTKNITMSGIAILDLSVVVLPETVSQSSGWNPLFGFTGISLGGVTLDSTDILSIFAVFSISLIVLGAMKSQKLLYTGLFFLSLIGMIVVGIFVVGVVIGSYFAGFLVIRSYFGYRSRQRGM
jgi:hypothetical protein